MWRLQILVLLIGVVSETCCINVLLSLPISTEATNDVFCGIAKALINNGDRVTFLSPRPPDFSSQNLTSLKIVTDKVLLKGIDFFQVTEANLSVHVQEVLSATSYSMWDGLTFKNLIDDINDYDVIVIPKLLNEISFPFLYNFQGVFITLYDEDIEHFILDVVSGAKKWDHENIYVPDDQLPCQRSVFWQSVAAMPSIFPNTWKNLNFFKEKLGSLEKYVQIKLGLYL